jgi:hypothetical protein
LRISLSIRATYDVNVSVITIWIFSSFSQLFWFLFFRLTRVYFTNLWFFVIRPFFSAFITTWFQIFEKFLSIFQI